MKISSSSQIPVFRSIRIPFQTTERSLQARKRSPSQRVSVSVARASTSMSPSVSNNGGDTDLCLDATEAIVWCSLHGLVVGTASPTPTTMPTPTVHAPITLAPTPVDAACFEKAKALAKPFNILNDRVAMDVDYLEEILGPVSEADSFLRRIMEIWRDARREKGEDGYSNQLRLGLIRSDYMIDEKNSMLNSDNGDTSSVIKQIELNTISTSFPALGSIVSKLHQNLYNSKYSEADNKKILPFNDGMNGFAHAMANAMFVWSKENTSAKDGNENIESVVLFVVQENERNIYDQYWLADVLFSKYKIKSVRATLTEIAASAKLDKDRDLFYKNDKVGVIYYRSGYSPSDYISEACWQARKLMELSSAVSCPNAAYHLSGSKKVQQDLAAPGRVESYFPEDDKGDVVTFLRSCFAGLYAPHSDKAIVEEAIKNPSAFVLKPQREGGGNNIYDEDVRDMLVKSDGAKDNSLEKYILMERIWPKSHNVKVMREGKVETVEAISELGIYASILARGGNSSQSSNGNGVSNGKSTTILSNTHCGHLLRTKVSTSNEGGVAAGYAYLDSPKLV